MLPHHFWLAHVVHFVTNERKVSVLVWRDFPLWYETCLRALTLENPATSLRYKMKNELFYFLIEHLNAETSARSITKRYMISSLFWRSNMNMITWLLWIVWCMKSKCQGQVNLSLFFFKLNYWLSRFVTMWLSEDTMSKRYLNIFISLRNGCCTMACLKSVGTVPIRRQVLIMDNTLGPIVSKMSLKWRVGIMSRRHRNGLKGIEQLINLGEQKLEEWYETW